MKKSLDSNSFLKQKFYIRLLIVFLTLGVITLAILVPYFLGVDVGLLSGFINKNYQVGSIAHSDLKAIETFYYIDEAETLLKQQLASKESLPIFKLSELETALIHSNLEKSLKTNIALNNLEANEKVLLSQLIQKLVNRYATSGIFNFEELSSVNQQGYFEIDVVNGQPNKRETKFLYSYESALADAKEQLELYDDLFGLEEKNIGLEILASVLKENVFYDLLETKDIRQKASMEVEPTIVRVEKGQFILKKDHVITNSDMKALLAMKIAASKVDTVQLVGKILFVVLVTIYAIYAFYITFNDSYRKFQYLILFLASVFVTQGILYFVLKSVAPIAKVSNDPFLPLFVAPILIALVTNNKRSGIIAALLLGSYALLLPNATLSILFFVVAIASGAIYFIRFVNKRVDVLFQWSFSMVLAVVILIVNNLFNGYGLNDIIQPAGVLLINISITYAAVSVLLPLLELIWNFPTPFRLR
jgi:membrane-associated HD superfamily phosphohydrolase